MKGVLVSGATIQTWIPFESSCASQSHNINFSSISASSLSLESISTVSNWLQKQEGAWASRARRKKGNHFCGDGCGRRLFWLWWSPPWWGSPGRAWRPWWGLSLPRQIERNKYPWGREAEGFVGYGPWDWHSFSSQVGSDVGSTIRNILFWWVVHLNSIVRID